MNPRDSLHVSVVNQDLICPIFLLCELMYVHMRGWAGLVTKILGSPEEALNSNSKSIKRQAYLIKEVETNSEKTKHCQNSPGVRSKTCVKLQLESFGYL